jgi:hypothetical protein
MPGCMVDDDHAFYTLLGSHSFIASWRWTIAGELYDCLLCGGSWISLDKL